MAVPSNLSLHPDTGNRLAGARIDHAPANAWRNDSDGGHRLAAERGANRDENRIAQRDM